MQKISTRNLSALPDINNLQKLCKALATLDAIFCENWEYRYYSYNKNWDKENKEEYFQMRDGSGDEFHILFSRHGAIINGFAHESPMSGWREKEIPPSSLMDKLGVFFGKKKETKIEQNIWKGVVDSVPSEYKEFIFGEPIRSSGTTFCIWRKLTDNKWNIGNINFPEDDYGDGSQELLYIFDNNPHTYIEWATEYFDNEFEGHELKLELVQSVYDNKPLTKEIVSGINPKLNDYEQLKSDLDEIGYEFSEF